MKIYFFKSGLYGWAPSAGNIDSFFPHDIRTGGLIFSEVIILAIVDKAGDLFYHHPVVNAKGCIVSYHV
jgi:hypothetical protein